MGAALSNNTYACFIEWNAETSAKMPIDINNGLHLLGYLQRPENSSFMFNQLFN